MPGGSYYTKLVFSKRTTVRKEMYDRVAAKRSKPGLPGEAPTVRAFEQDEQVVYNEVGGFEPGKQPGEEKPDALYRGAIHTTPRPPSAPTAKQAPPPPFPEITEEQRVDVSGTPV